MASSWRHAELVLKQVAQLDTPGLLPVLRYTEVENTPGPANAGLNGPANRATGLAFRWGFCCLGVCV